MYQLFNIASGSEANITTPCEKLKISISHGVVILASEPDAMLKLTYHTFFQNSDVTPH